MSAKNRLITDFYELRVHQLMDKRIWDLPLIEQKADIDYVLSILGGRNHIWVVNDKNDNILVGVITEHDVLSILAPKSFPSYVFGMPDIRSIKHGTAKTASTNNPLFFNSLFPFSSIRKEFDTRKINFPFFFILSVYSNSNVVAKS